MLCNECAANLLGGSWLEVLMSSFVFVCRIRIQVCDDLCGIVRVYHSSQALHDQRSPDHRQQTEDKTEGNCGSFGASVVCFAQVDAQIVEEEVYYMQSQAVSAAWAHGMVSSLCCCCLLLAFIIPIFCLDYFFGRINRRVENSTQNFA